jgi:putative sterol carrier protein
MSVYRYCTPEWLEESARLYDSNPRFRQEFAKLTMSVCFQVNAEPAWGLDETIYFMASVDRGELKGLSFLTAADAHQAADFVLAASPQEWKKILRRENKFVTDFMLGKINLVKGSKVAVLSLAPYSNTFVETLTQLPLQFPDEMTVAELDCYREDVLTFRHTLKV